MAAIVKLASSPTHFSQQWHYSDLEVLGIRCYQPPTVGSAAADGEGQKEEGGEAQPQSLEEPPAAEEAGPPAEETTPTSEEATEGDTPTEEDVVLEGLPSEIQDMLKVGSLHPSYSCQSLPVTVRAPRL